jgi:hypothetical protein
VPRAVHRDAKQDGLAHQHGRVRGDQEEGQQRVGRELRAADAAAAEERARAGQGLEDVDPKV